MFRNRLGISVRDAKELEAFKDVEVVAGAGGLDRKIFHINVMEVPDILDWVQEGELLFTTLYSLREDPAEQVALIPHLAAKKLAALAIKPKRYIEEIPSDALRLADELDFPILQLPQHVSFSSIMEPLINEIFDFQTVLLNRSEWAHNKLLDIVLQGGGLDQLVGVLETLVTGEVAIFDGNKEPLTKVSPRLTEWVNQLDWSVLKGATRLTLVAGKQTGLVVPLLAGGSQLGVLFAVGKEGEDTDSEAVHGYSVLDEITLERAATVAALEILNARALEEVERRFHNEFVIDLVEGAYHSEDVACQRARTNKWVICDRMRVLLIHLLDFRVQKQKDKILKFIRGHFCQCITGEIGWDIVLITSCDFYSETVGWLRSNLDKLETLAESKLIVGVGRDTRSIREIKYSYRQAKLTVKISRKVPKLGCIVDYDQLGIYRLLDELRGKPEMEAFIRDNLKKLLDYDLENDMDLFPTLCNYFAEGGNMKQVANAMFVHYNTVIYRMDRIQNILGIKLDNSHQRLSLEVAIQALNFIKDR